MYPKCRYAGVAIRPRGVHFKIRSARGTWEEASEVRADRAVPLREYLQHTRQTGRKLKLKVVRESDRADQGLGDEAA